MRRLLGARSYVLASVLSSSLGCSSNDAPHEDNQQASDESADDSDLSEDTSNDPTADESAPDDVTEPDSDEGAAETSSGGVSEVSTADATNESTPDDTSEQPVCPAIVGFEPFPGQKRAMVIEVVDDVAFVGNDFGFEIFDVSDPKDFVVKATWREFEPEATGILVDGDRLYVNAFYTLHILDVSDLTNPVELGFVDLYGEFNGGRPRGMELAGNLLFIANRENYPLRVVDVSDPAAPVELFTGFDTPGVATDLALRDNFALLSIERHGLGVFDISTPPDFEEVTVLETDGVVRGLELVDDVAYLAKGTGIWLVDVSDPIAPSELSTLALGEGETFDVKVVDSTAYVADWYEGLHVVDVSDPRNPVKLRTIAPTEPGDVQLFPALDVANGLVYLTSTNNGIFVIDPSRECN